MSVDLLCFIMLTLKTISAFTTGTRTLLFREIALKNKTQLDGD